MPQTKMTIRATTSLASMDDVTKLLIHVTHSGLEDVLMYVILPYLLEHVLTMQTDPRTGCSRSDRWSVGSSFPSRTDSA